MDSRPDPNEPQTAQEWLERRDRALAFRATMQAMQGRVQLRQSEVNPDLAPPHLRREIKRLLRALRAPG